MHKNAQVIDQFDTFVDVLFDLDGVKLQYTVMMMIQVYVVLTAKLDTMPKWDLNNFKCAICCIHFQIFQLKSQNIHPIWHILFTQ